MTKTELKHSAQDRLLGYMAEAIFRADDEGDTEMAAEMLRQAQRAMTLFGVASYPGLTKQGANDMAIIYTTTKDAFTYRYSHGGAVTVPAGARTQSASALGGDFRWVDPLTFPAGSIERHDAEHYGIRVPLSNVNMWKA